MKARRSSMAALLLGAALLLPLTAATQGMPDDQPAPAGGGEVNVPVDPGVLIQTPVWMLLTYQRPYRVRVKHGFVDSLTYGAVAADIVADYKGAHAVVEVTAAEPVVCICHVGGMPGTPRLVRLHGKKDFREFDGGHMHPIIAEGKTAEARKNDLIPTVLTNPEDGVWLLQPRAPMQPGEYAVMLGKQNLDVFPFAVTGATGNSGSSAHKKH